MSNNSDIDQLSSSKERVLNELMGPKRDLEDKEKMAMTKHFEQNLNNESNDLVLLGDIINETNEYQLNNTTNGKINHQMYFSSTKKNRRKMNHRRESNNNYNNNEKPNKEDIDMVDLANEVGVIENLNTQESSKINLHHLPPFKENYLDYLITAADSLIDKGEISLSYLNTKNNLKEEEDCEMESEIEEKNNELKCRNKLCSNIINPYSTSIYCKECDDEYQKGNYCFYCRTIYKKIKLKNNREWVQCYYCHKYNHTQCEAELGTYSNIGKLSQNKGFKYMCPLCKKNKVNGINKKNSNSKKKIQSIDNSSNNILYYKTKFKNKNQNENKDIFQDFIKIIELDEEANKHCNNKISNNSQCTTNNKKKNK